MYHLTQFPILLLTAGDTVFDTPVVLCLLAGSVRPERVVPASGPAALLSGAEAAGAPRGPPQGLPHQGGAGAGVVLGLQLPSQHPLCPQPVQHPEQAVASHG